VGRYTGIVQDLGDGRGGGPNNKVTQVKITSFQLNRGHLGFQEKSWSGSTNPYRSSVRKKPNADGRRNTANLRRSPGNRISAAGKARRNKKMVKRKGTRKRNQSRAKNREGERRGCVEGETADGAKSMHCWNQAAFQEVERGDNQRGGIA